MLDKKQFLYNAPQRQDRIRTWFETCNSVIDAVSDEWSVAVAVGNEVDNTKVASVEDAGVAIMSHIMSAGYHVL